MNIADKYDLDIKMFFEQSNEHASAQIFELMLEANRYDAVTNNEKFSELVSVQAAGFGLESLTSELAIPHAKLALGQTTQQIAGQKLEQVQIQKMDKMVRIIPLFILISIVLLGVVRLLMERPSNPA